MSILLIAGGLSTVALIFVVRHAARVPDDRRLGADETTSAQPGGES